MTKRNIADDEIALIKAMLARGMKNKDIQFFFNRPDRSVNSGRITGIRKGIYGGSNKIPAASDSALDAFMAKHPPTSDVAAVAVPPSDAASDPLDAKAIKRLFRKTSEGTWQLSVGETDGHECKTSFGMKHPQAWLRAIAALSNNAGGYIFFGVTEKGTGDAQDHVVVGLPTDDFKKIDPAALAQKVRSVFDPTPRFRTATVSVGGMTIGVIHVERHDSRPVIATKHEGDKINEGDIFFRYPGQSARIKYSDLRSMLDARDKEARAQILPMVERLLRLGPRRTLVADLDAGTLGDGQATIHLDDALVQKLTFIKEGEFTELEGAPTLRLIGDVHAAGAPLVTKTELSLLTREGLLKAFLTQSHPPNPDLYIRFAVEVGQGEWFPLHYFARLAGMTRVQLVEFINATSGTESRKTTYIKRVQPNAAFHKAVGTPKAILEEIMAGNLPTVSNWQEASHVSQAIGALPHDAEFEREAILKLLSDCLPLVAGKGVVSFVRRGICRVDELLFASD